MMDAKTFYQKVKLEAGLKDELAARRAAKAVLQTLHWRIAEGEADNIASSLPPQLQKIWRGDWGMRLSKTVLKRVDKLDKKQFISRVKNASRSFNVQEAEKLATAVIHVLKEAIPAGETKDMLSQLPSDLRKFVKAA